MFYELKDSELFKDIDIEDFVNLLKQAFESIYSLDKDRMCIEYSEFNHYTNLSLSEN